MEQNAIFGPVLALVLLTWVVWIYMFSKRIPFLNSLESSSSEVTPARLVTLFLLRFPIPPII